MTPTIVTPEGAEKLKQAAWGLPDDVVAFALEASGLRGDLPISEVPVDVAYDVEMMLEVSRTQHMGSELRAPIAPTERPLDDRTRRVGAAFQMAHVWGARAGFAAQEAFHRWENAEFEGIAGPYCPPEQADKAFFDAIAPHARDRADLERLNALR